MPAQLEAKGVSVRVGQKTLLDRVDLKAEAGQVLALVGPNGAGKTTLLKALLGLRPHTGTVQVCGRPLAALSTTERARQIAYVPQSTLLTARVTGRDVVAQGRFAHGEAHPNHQQAIDRALKDTDCQGLGNRPFAVCSGGERSRLLLARALATEAPLLLLDEPTASLDLAHGLHLHSLLRQLAAAGKTIVIVQHQLADALRWSDSVLVLKNGQHVASGATKAVLTAALIEEVFGLRLRHDGIAFDLAQVNDAN